MFGPKELLHLPSLFDAIFVYNFSSLPLDNYQEMFITFTLTEIYPSGDVSATVSKHSAERVFNKNINLN